MDIKCAWRMEIDVPSFFEQEDYEDLLAKVKELYNNYVENVLPMRKLRRETFCAKCGGLLPKASTVVMPSQSVIEIKACSCDRSKND
jgi:hypothetical protein